MSILRHEDDDLRGRFSKRSCTSLGWVLEEHAPDAMLRCTTPFRENRRRYEDQKFHTLIVINEAARHEEGKENFQRFAMLWGLRDPSPQIRREWSYMSIILILCY